MIWSWTAVEGDGEKWLDSASDMKLAWQNLLVGCCVMWEEEKNQALVQGFGDWVMRKMMSPFTEMKKTRAVENFWGEHQGYNFMWLTFESSIKYPIFESRFQGKSCGRRWEFDYHYYMDGIRCQVTGREHQRMDIERKGDEVPSVSVQMLQYLEVKKMRRNQQRGPKETGKKEENSKRDWCLRGKKEKK